MFIPCAGRPFLLCFSEQTKKARAVDPAFAELVCLRSISRATFFEGRSPHPRWGGESISSLSESMIATCLSCDYERPFLQQAKTKNKALACHIFPICHTPSLLDMTRLSFLTNQRTAHVWARAYPRGTRADSSNMDPRDAWASGIQMCALNLQVNVT